MSVTRLVRRLKASRATVYRALVDARAVAAWMVPEGMTSQVHEFEARPGGRFRVSLSYDESSRQGKTSAHTDTYHGRFLELVPDRRVVQVLEFETADTAMQGEMVMRFDLRDTSDGVELTAVHEGVPEGVSPADNELGWNMSLDKLARLVEGGECARS